MKLPTSHLLPGMKLNRAVYGSQGEILLNRGTVLTSRYIFSLKRCGVLAVEVETGLPVDEISANNAIIDQVKAEVMNSLQNWVCVKTRRVTAELLESIKNIIDEILKGGVSLGNLTEILAYDAYTFARMYRLKKKEFCLSNFN